MQFCLAAMAILLFSIVAPLRAIQVFRLGVTIQATVLAACGVLVLASPLVVKLSGRFAVAAHFGITLAMQAIVFAPCSLAYWAAPMPDRRGPWFTGAMFDEKKHSRGTPTPAMTATPCLA